MGIFDYNGRLMDALRKFSDIVLYNIIFCALSLPVLTAGAGMCALCECVRLVAEETDTEKTAFGTFWDSFKRHFKRAGLLWLVALLVLLVLLMLWLSLSIMPEGLRAIYTMTFYLLAVVALIGYQYYFPLAAKYEDWSVRQIIRNSFLLAIAALPQTMLTIGITAGFAYVTLVMNMNVFRFGIFLWCTCGFGIVTYINSFFFIRVTEKLQHTTGEGNEETDHRQE